MKAFVLVFMLVAGTVSVAVAQDAEETHDFGARKLALSFNFNSFTPDKFKGGIGGKLWTSETFAWITSVNGEYADQEYKGHDDETRWGLGLLFGFEKHRRIVHKISPYFGTSIEATQSERNVKREGDPERTHKVTVLAGTCHLGVEYWVLQDMSLGAEYGMGISYATSKCTDCDPEVEVTAMSVGISTASLILSFYF